MLTRGYLRVTNMVNLFIIVCDATAFKTHVKDTFKELLPLHCYPAENILQLLAYSFDGTRDKDCSIIFPYMPNGSLYDKLNPEQQHGVNNTYLPLTWQQRANVALGVARGLTHLHSIPIMHGDIKSPNILLDRNFEPKIGDFGGVAHLTLMTHYTVQLGDNICGTRDYLPADYLRSAQARVQVDVFSFGMLLFELMSGKHPGYKIGENTFRNIITELPATPTPTDWFDNAEGLNLKPFRFPAMTAQRKYEMTTTTLPEQLFAFGTMCAKYNYRKRPKMGDVLEGLERQMKSYILTCKLTKAPDDHANDRTSSQYK